MNSIRRWNRLRKWYDHARPQVLHHTVWGVPNVDEAAAFYVKRLGFRVTDMIRNVGVFMRCDGRPDHHNPFLHRGQKAFFNHAAFGVENIDELMTGVNEMQRKGWTSKEGLGRHRMTSIIFCYLDCPSGGTVEYMCDSDYLTDEWEPHLWDPGFADAIGLPRARPIIRPSKSVSGNCRNLSRAFRRLRSCRCERRSSRI